MVERYKYADIDGRRCAIDTITGEIKDVVNRDIISGSLIFTPAQQEAYKEYKQREEERKYKRKTLKELGDFYFVSRLNLFSELTPETAARLIFLCTFLNYDNHFVFSKNKPMRKRDLQDILGLSIGTVYKFWREVSPLYIIEDDEGLKLSSNDIVRGNIKTRRESFQRFYNQAIRRLYRASDVSRHKHLGYVFKTIPFINPEFNILCWNTDEKALDDIEQIAVADFCKMIGYNAHDYKKLLRIYKDITFDVNGHQETFLNCVTNNDDMSTARLYVNPHILYCGSNYKRVEILGAFCKTNNRFS